MKKQVFYLLILFPAIFLNCSGGGDVFSFKGSKIWAHRINNPDDANTKMKAFTGIEIDLAYDSISGNLYVSHDIDASRMQMTFRQYMRQIERPSKSYYWLDVKNLFDNPEKICDTIICIARDFGIENKFFVESWSAKALKSAKEKGVTTSLWVENITGKIDCDTLRWLEKYKKIVEEVQVDALSADYRMRHLLNEYFPEIIINLWQTPAEFNDENVEITREICRDPHVKVLLVDYDKPVSY